MMSVLSSCYRLMLKMTRRASCSRLVKLDTAFILRSLCFLIAIVAAFILILLSLPPVLALTGQILIFDGMFVAIGSVAIAKSSNRLATTCTLISNYLSLHVIFDHMLLRLCQILRFFSLVMR